MVGDKLDSFNEFIKRHNHGKFSPPRPGLGIPMPIPMDQIPEPEVLKKPFREFCEMNDYDCRFEDRMIFHLDDAERYKTELEADGWKCFFVVIGHGKAHFGLARKKWGDWSDDELR